jgi:molybdopterin molybdotransferase
MKDMLGRGEAVTAEAALRLILENLHVKAPKEEKIKMEEACRRVLSSDIFSPEDLPGFPRSTMDGYAVRAGDTFGATESLPAYLTVAHEIQMAEEPSFTLKEGQAASIPTGGMLPKGADAVLMLEHSQKIDDKTIEAQKQVAPGENVIQKGEDVKRGELVLEKGHILRPQDIAALSGLGITEVFVYRRPRVSIISTGDEVIPPHEPLRPGLVRDINSYNLSCLVSEDGGEPLRKGIFKDRYDAIRDAVHASISDSGMVLITGGSSVGARDMTEGIINGMGSPGVLFHGVALKPGKPLIGGVIGGTPVFGIPGHPAAVTICYEILIRHVLRHISGAKAGFSSGLSKTVYARLAKRLSSEAGREEHVRVALKRVDGELWAEPILGKSGLITTLVKADGTVKVPLGEAGMEKGKTVEVRLFD